MRALAGSLVLAILATATPSFAQTAYDYPYCALRGGRDGGGTSCYFTSYRQCMDSLVGIGGSCIRSPYYRGPEPRRDKRYLHD
jgi:hypothetical protein